MATRNAESVDGRAGGISSLQATSSLAMGPLYRLNTALRRTKICATRTEWASQQL